MGRRARAKAKAEQTASRPMLLRSIAIALTFVLCAGFLGVRLFHLQVDEVDEWRARAANQQLTNVAIEPARGIIYDANMRPLAQNNTVWNIEAAPNMLVNSNLKEAATETNAARLAAKELARILSLDEDELYANLSDGEKLYYRVKGKIEQPLAEEVRTMCSTYGIRGIYIEQDSKRFYPYEELAATVLGFTNADNQGIEGIESWYNEELAGTPGRQVAVQNAWGGEIPAGDEEAVYAAEDGYDLVLTVDVDIQQSVEKNLSAAVAQYTAKQRGMCIVMDVNTGAILAMAVCPAYNANDPYAIYDEATQLLLDEMPDGDDKTRAQGEARTLQWRNKALADTYEPGSVLKVITAAAAMDSGVYTQDSTFSCTSSVEIADREFGCALGTAHGSPTLRQALIDSCNVSFIRMSEGMGAHVWYDYLNAFGLTEPTGVDLPGEPGPRAISNLVYSEDELGPVQLASCSFGQSNKYTALQMITAVSAAVNGGNLMQPYIVSQVRDASGNVIENIEPQVKRQVISPETSAIIASTLEEMVESTSNGRNAYVAGYHVGGKSGTSQKLELLAQENREEYISSFLGFAPANNPQIAVLVVLDEPEDPDYGTYFGGRLAGPTAGKIIEETLQILGVDPEYSSPEELARTTRSCPKLVGLNLSDAYTSLNQNGLQPITVGQGPTVVGQYPEAFTEIPNGGQVVLYTEAGTTQEIVKVPDVRTLSAAEAVRTLQNLGLNVITTGAPDTGENVEVVEQSVQPEIEVAKGTIVTLTMQDTSVVADH